ncbi:Cationic amino acid transporter 5 [Ananas comosus]|uniref:Cationic amino acid transporter 5 n=1 Tax=Ananas comosus TaxID=4615 RepID=A0A199VCJ8_ANACO|nr:Cationic amino acid transporter 5 [Ananas comosus]
MYCPFLKPRRIGEPSLHRHSSSLMMRHRASREEILCARGLLSPSSDKAGYLPADNYCLFNGDFGLLGIKTTRVDRVLGNYPSLDTRTLGIQLFVPQCQKPKVWGVPLVPWLPSLSIATNLFLMGSLGSQAFIRFGLCTGIMMIYYVFFGVHATYDMAHAHPDEALTKQAEKKGDMEKASAEL